ncbi:hypothetical protein [Bacillus cereus]|uniref:Uncharacterized protein n=1 Tax=Bacillus cereus HuA3-9 TaxID=1053205 RepID=R8CID0_BACCE|nr:hypothetical protein [Bacillus cereus]EOO11371.1 hypothetical protein IGA_05634 [Bacillus cereus HuA3-9]
MSKIAKALSHLSSHGAKLSVDKIVEDSTVRDIKEYITYLQNEVKRKEESNKELIIENVTMKVKLEKYEESA